MLKGNKQPFSTFPVWLRVSISKLRISNLSKDTETPPRAGAASQPARINDRSKERLPFHMICCELSIKRNKARESGGVSSTTRQPRSARAQAWNVQFSRGARLSTFCVVDSGWLRGRERGEGGEEGVAREGGQGTGKEGSERGEWTKEGCWSRPGRPQIR